MKRLDIALLCIALLAVASVLGVAPVAGAADAVCVASPSSGPDGTTFSLTASGFSPNSRLWTYAVDPTGVAFADPVNQGYGGGLRADKRGTVTFPFTTRYVEGDTGTLVSRSIGRWTLVVEERNGNNQLVHQAECGLTITSTPLLLVGAQVLVTPSTGFQDNVYTIAGSGFEPYEMVSLWLTPPGNCGAFAFELGGQVTFHGAAAAFGFSTVRTDSSGNFVDALLPNTFTYCTGEWAVSARGATSDRGGIARFVITPHSVNPNGATLIVQPNVAPTKGGVLLFSGAGFKPGENVACWYSRPEGNVREIHGMPADASGKVRFVYVTGFDGLSATSITPNMHYSEGSPGLYAMSCVGQTSQHLAITQFTLVAAPIDP